MSLRIPLTNDQTLQVEFHEIERRLRRMEKNLGVGSKTNIFVQGSGGATLGVQSILDRLDALEAAIAGLGSSPSSISDYKEVGPSATKGLVPTPGTALPPTGVAQHVLTEDNYWGYPLRGLIQVATPGNETVPTDTVNVLGSLGVTGDASANNLQSGDAFFTGTATAKVVDLYNRGGSGETNYERGLLYFQGNSLTLATQKGGGGIDRPLVLWPSSGVTNCLTSLSPFPDGTYTLGSTAARWKQIGVGGNSGSIPVVIKLATVHATSALEVQNSSAAVLAKVTPEGDVWGKGQSFATVAKTGNYTVAAGDHAVMVSAAGGNVTITLPAAASHTGRIIHIKKTDSSSNYVRIDGNASELVEDAVTQDLLLQGENLMLQCDGTQWWVL